jgi:hypothetical protein
VLFPLLAIAQIVEAEKTYDISRKAKKGALANVDWDGTHYLLTYVTKATDSKIKMEHYLFDLDFNFVEMKEQVETGENLKKEHKWFKWQGENYSIESNTVEASLTGTLSLRKRKITYTYDYDNATYDKKVETLNKVEPRSDDGRKFFYYSHGEDDITGDIYILCGIKPTMKDTKEGGQKMGLRQMFDLVVLKYNKALDLVGEVPIQFEYPQEMAFARSLPSSSDDREIESMCFIFAPYGAPGSYKFSDPEKTNFHYVRVSHNLKIVDNIKFTSHQSYWNIEEVIFNNNSIYLFGPSSLGKDKYFTMLKGSQKFKSVQLMKVANNKIEYLTETDLPEFKSKLKTPPSQKKAPAYEGKKFYFANSQVSSSGDFFVIVQNKDDKGYNDVLTFHFDSKGVLKAQYSLDVKESNKYAKEGPADQDLVESLDGKSMYWFLREVRGVAQWSGNKPLTYPRIGKIDIANGTLSDFKEFGKIGKETFYLDPNFPYLKKEGQNVAVFFGSDKSGGTLWFCRVNIQE